MNISTIISIASTVATAFYLTALYLAWRPVARRLNALQQTAEAVLARAVAANERM